jgi:hypothetical protein
MCVETEGMQPSELDGDGVWKLKGALQDKKRFTALDDMVCEVVAKLHIGKQS